MVERANNCEFDIQRVEGAEGVWTIAITASSEKDKAGFFLNKVWKSYWSKKEYGEWLSRMKSGWKKQRHYLILLLAAGCNMSAISCLVSNPIHSFLLFIFSISLKLYSWNPFAIAIGYGNFVSNLPSHSYRLGFGTALSQLLVSYCFPIVLCFE